MAEPRKLHAAGTHVAMRGVFGFVAAMVTAVAVGVATEPRTEVGSWVVLGWFCILLWVVGRIVLTTSPVWLNGDHLEVGKGASRRRIDFADIVAVEYPWWSLSERLAVPLEITLREGPPVFFFPEHGAEDLIAGGRRHARDPLDFE